MSENNAKNEWPFSSTGTKLEFLEKPVTSADAPKSPPAPEPSAEAKARYAEINAQEEAIRRRPQ
jgi:hypothetical protein